MRFAMRSICERSVRDLRAVGLRRAFARFGPGGVEICERLKRSAVDFVRAILLPSGARL